MVECPWGLNKQYLGELQPAAIFNPQNGAPYVPPAAAPLTHPHIPPDTTTGTHKELKALNNKAQKSWQTCINVCRIVVNQAADAIDKVYYAKIEDPTEGLNGVEIRDFIDHICNRYCHIDQADLDTNLNKFQQGIDPSVPLIMYIHKQEDVRMLHKMMMYPFLKRP